MPTERDTIIIEAPVAKLRATRRAKRRLESSGWLWRSYMEGILVPERFTRFRPRLSRPCPRPPPGWRRTKTLATGANASAWPALRGSSAGAGRGCARAARAAAGRARAASAAFSHLGGDGSQCLRTLDAELLADLRLDLGGELRVLLQEVAGVVLALADAVLLVLIPGSGL